jgi:hypothetical protein
LSIKISELPSATTPLAGTEQVPLVQSGITKRASATAISGLPIAAQGDVIYGSAAGVYSTLAKDTNATRYLSNTGSSNNPAWAQVNLANGVTGDLPFSSLTQLAGLSVLGVTGSSTADVAAITAGTDNQVLRRSGASLAFGGVNLASANAVSGALSATNGGTGLTAIAQGDVLYGDAANSLARLPKDTNASRYLSNNNGFALIMLAQEGLTPDDIGFSDGTFNGTFGFMTGDVSGQGVCRLFHEAALEEFGLYFQTPLVPEDFIFSIVVETDVGARTYLQSNATITEVGGRRQYTWDESDVLFSSGGTYAATVYLTAELNSPVWNPVNLLNGVSGVLQASNGGTGHTAGGVTVYDSLPEDEFGLAPPRTWTLSIPRDYGSVPGILKWKFFFRYANQDAVNVPLINVSLATNGSPGLASGILEMPPGVYCVSFDAEIALPADGGGGAGVTGVISQDAGNNSLEFGVSPQLIWNGQFVAFPETNLTLTIDDNGTNPSQSVALVYAYAIFIPGPGNSF